MPWVTYPVSGLLLISQPLTANTFRGQGQAYPLSTPTKNQRQCAEAHYLWGIRTLPRQRLLSDLSAVAGILLHGD